MKPQFKFDFGNGVWLAKNLIGLTTSYVLILSVLSISLLMRSKGKTKHEWGRKFVHIAVAHWSLIYYFLIDNFYIALFVPLTFVAVNALSHRFNVIKSIERQENPNYPGTVYYAMSFALLAGIGSAFDLKIYAVGAMLAFGWGDALAGIIGISFGRRKISAPFSEKSTAGSAACFVMCFLISALVPIADSLFTGTPPPPPLYVLGFAFCAGTVGAATEVVALFGLDNILMPAALFFSYLLFGYENLRIIYVALSVSVFVAGIAFSLKALTGDAFFAAVVTGVLLYRTGGVYLFGALIAFYLIASAAGAVRRRAARNAQTLAYAQMINDKGQMTNEDIATHNAQRTTHNEGQIADEGGERRAESRDELGIKDEKHNTNTVMPDEDKEISQQQPSAFNLQLSTSPSAKRGRRAVQVFCNSAPALLFSTLFYFLGDIEYLIGAYGALAFALSDTLGSEIGILSKKQPLDIVTFKPVKKGLSGGVSLLGLFASIVGAACIAALPMLCGVLDLPPEFYTPKLTKPYSILPAVMVLCGGFLGALFDSFLGSRFQAKYVLSDGSGLSDDPASDGSRPLARGFRFVNNNLVNLISCSMAGVVCFAAGLFL